MSNSRTRRRLVVAAVAVGAVAAVPAIRAATAPRGQADVPTATSAAAKDTGGMNQLWSRSLGVAITGTPAVDGSNVAVPTAGGYLTDLKSWNGMVRYTTRAAGGALNSPRLDSDQIFVSSKDCTVRAFDKATGTQQWSSSLPSGCSQNTAGVGLAAGNVIAPSSNGAISGLAASTGRQLYAARNVYSGTKNAPATAGSTAYTAWDYKTLTARDAASGALRWKATLGSYLRGSAAEAGGRVFLGDDAGTFYAVDAATGAVRWKRALSPSSTNPLSRATPVVTGSTVITTVGQRSGYGGAVIAMDTATGAVKWRTELTYTEAGVAVDGGVVYAITSEGQRSRLSALALDDGHVLSQTDASLAGKPVGSPQVGGYAVVVATDSGQVMAVHTVSPTAPAASSPSGVPMPTGDLAGWHQVFADDFTGNLLDGKNWTTYTGAPRAYPDTLWKPENVVVGGGRVDLVTQRDPGSGQISTGGISNARSLTQAYGKYEVRMRADRASGVGVVALLWPSGGAAWPPEVDFVEDGSGGRVRPYATLHYGSDNKQIHKFTDVDMTQWHTYGVEWKPGSLTYTLDGEPFGTVTGSIVPTIKMELDIQGHTDGCRQAGSCAVSGKDTVDTEIDWVTAYSHTG